MTVRVKYISRANLFLLIRPGSLADLIKVMNNNKGKKTRLVLGNTSTGRNKIHRFNIYIYIWPLHIMRVPR